mmetsp:Transcript_53956/g.136770  ORF Transcript_53956/g.136770 Transcript_53956/m.136770 type:complete len:304 (+) Transcript_53956:67-978(+)
MDCSSPMPSPLIQIAPPLPSAPSKSNKLRASMTAPEPSPLITMVMGAICGTADTTLLQSTNYLKCAKQQGLPFTLRPSVLYRGYVVNTMSNSVCVMSQFLFNGLARRAITFGETRPLTNMEKVGCGVFAGALAGIVCSPMELVMIQQQRFGGGLIPTALAMCKGGPSVLMRGSLGMSAREGIYAGGFLGLMPVVREHVQHDFPDTLGKSADTARLTAAVTTGPLCTFLSHPPDTLKTLMQGDVGRQRYEGYMQTAKLRVGEAGLQELWSGMSWRLGRQACCVFLFDKINSDLTPLLFPPTHVA